MKKRIFDKSEALAIKGLAVILMVVHHCFRVPELYTGYNVIFFPFTESRINNICTFFKLCVGTFAFISGYGLTEIWRKNSSECSISEFVSRRYFKSITNYWFVFIISAVITQVLDCRFTSVYCKSSWLENATDILAAFFGIGNLIHTPLLCTEWWYISAMVTFIILVPFFNLFIDKIGGGLAVIVTIVVPRILGREFTGGMDTFSFITPMLLGVIFSKYNFFQKIGNYRLARTSSKNLNAVINFFADLVIFFLAYKLYMLLPKQNYWEISYGVVPVIAVLFFYRYITIFPLFRRTLGFFGKHSGNIYLVHTLIRSYMAPLLYKQPHFFFTCFLLLAASLLCSMLIDGLKRITHFDNFIDWVYRRLLGQKALFKI